MSTYEGPRFWITDPNRSEDYMGFGLVDEEVGGIVAYFNSHSYAVKIATTLNSAIDFHDATSNSINNL